MFFNKKSVDDNLNILKEEPLGYWEEKSYMVVIPKDETQDIFEGMFDRVANINGVEVKKKFYPNEKWPGKIEITYDGEEYEIGFFINDNFALPEMLGLQSYYFSKEEMAAIQSASKALVIFMEFHKDAKKSFHLQLKLAVAMVPDMIGIMDESAEKLICSRWAKMTAESDILPGPNDLFMIQAVSEESGEVWLHTHGLCRCGLTELEILKSDKENYNNHSHILSTFASYLLDKNAEFRIGESSAYIGVLANNQPIVVTALSWVDGLKEYKDLKLGNVKDRKDEHNSKTSIVFAYKSEEDEKNKILTKVTEYNSLLRDNPILFISNEETIRMKTLAMERFHFVKEEATKSENKIIIKIGLPEDGSKENFEHIWFELVEFDGDKFRAKLIQEPYRVSNMHEGDEGWYTVNDVTDWVIYTPNFSVMPNTAYLLI